MKNPTEQNAYIPVDLQMDEDGRMNPKVIIWTDWQWNPLGNKVDCRPAPA